MMLLLRLLLLEEPAVTGNARKREPNERNNGRRKEGRRGRGGSRDGGREALSSKKTFQPATTLQALALLTFAPGPRDYPHLYP